MSYLVSFVVSVVLTGAWPDAVLIVTDSGVVWVATGITRVMLTP